MAIYGFAYSARQKGSRWNTNKHGSDKGHVRGYHIGKLKSMAVYLFEHAKLLFRDSVAA
jgi:hypothetical protein